MKMNPLVPSPPRRDRRAHGYRQETEPTNETVAYPVPLERTSTLEKVSSGVAERNL